MELVNRAAITVVPKEPYIDWANGLEQLGVKLTPENQLAPTVYLIEDISEYLVTDEEVMKRYFKVIFEAELRAWHRIEDDWPKKRGFKTFAKWFEFTVHSMVVDIHHDSFVTESFEL